MRGRVGIRPCTVPGRTFTSTGGVSSVKIPARLDREVNRLRVVDEIALIIGRLSAADRMASMTDEERAETDREVVVEAMAAVARAAQDRVVRDRAMERILRPRRASRRSRPAAAPCGASPSTSRTRIDSRARRCRGSPSVGRCARRSAPSRASSRAAARTERRRRRARSSVPRGIPCTSPRAHRRASPRSGIRRSSCSSGPGGHRCRRAGRRPSSSADDRRVDCPRVGRRRDRFPRGAPCASSGRRAEAGA